MIKRFLLILFVWMAVSRSYACGPYYEPDYEYYNLFMQELIDDPLYFPFLLSYDSRYYKTNLQPELAKNENIEEWEHYLGLSYEETFYLVFKASMEDIDALIDGENVSDEKLAFITPSFVKKHHAAFRYLAYAKYLEPYMQISQSADSWYYSEEDVMYMADLLDYDQMIDELKLRWKQSKDKELMLRYGYQLVRFAHYNRRYEESISFFNQFVESLNYKPAMYYHALSQKAGAERGVGDLDASLRNFFQVFVHSRDLKTKALSSISFDNDVDFNRFFEEAQTQEERNNIYLLLGFRSYNNPLNEIGKIVEVSPDAIQAKVLVARAINQIERDLMPVYYWGDQEMKSEVADKRYPLPENVKLKEFLDQVISLVDKMTISTNVTDKNFWYITSAYLHFLKKDFDLAQQMLDRVTPVDQLYRQQKQHLAMYIDICKRSWISADIETYLFGKYPEVLKLDLPEDIYSSNMSHLAYSTRSFVLDVLANRYYLQQEYAKSFLLSNKLSVLKNNPQLMLLDAVESFYHRTNRNKWENYLLSEATDIENVQSYIDYLYGIVYLTHGEMDKASDLFSKTTYNSGFQVSSAIFGYNRIECFQCLHTMESDYLSDFPFIPVFMNFVELTDVLMALDKIGRSENKQAAKANYLIGNFFYNVSEGGYFRYVLRFGSDNDNNSQRYRLGDKPDFTKQIYFKYYRNFYEDPNPVAQQYLEKAYAKASDHELKARIVFALSKCEQLAYNNSNKYYHIWSYHKGDEILISDRKYFKELMQYRKTKFFDVVQSNCKYFDYYVMNWDMSLPAR